MKTKTCCLVVLVWLFCSFQSAAQGGIHILHGPYLQDMSPEEVTIVWVTDENAVSWVELAPDDGTHFYLQERPKVFAVKNGIKTEGRIHAVKLKGLTPATKYRYRVFSQEVLSHVKTQVIYGKVASTSAGAASTFVTHDYTKGSMTFTMVNDIHQRSEVLEQALKWAEPLKNDLVFFNGDMMSTIESEDALFAGFMDVAVKAFAKNVPVYYTRGNHETRGDIASSFQNYFSPLSPSLYYLVRQGPVCFVVLDTGEDKPDSDIEYSGITAFDDYRSEQAAWLKEALQSKVFQDAPFKVVICHIPPQKDWHGDAEVLNKFVPLLNEAHIDIMLCGHIHRLIRKEATHEVRFPVLINSNNAFVKGSVTATELTLEVVGFDGKKTDSLSIKK
jgi:Icc-related predicted phosphoesterase